MSRDQMIPSALSHGTPGSLPPLSAMRRFGPVWIVRFPAVIRFARRAGLAGLLLWAGSGWSRADDRILLPVVINGQPRTFVFDTGCGRALVMYRSTAEKLGLQIASPSADIQPRPGKVLLGQTEPCTVTLLGRTGSSPFGILETPSDIIPDKAGLVGWPLVSQEIIRFRAVGQQEHRAAALDRHGAGVGLVGAEADLDGVLLPGDARLRGVCISGLVRELEVRESRDL